MRLKVERCDLHFRDERSVKRQNATIQRKCTFACLCALQTHSAQPEQSAPCCTKKSHKVQSCDIIKLFQQFPITSCPSLGQQTNSRVWEKEGNNHSHHVFDSSRFDLEETTPDSDTLFSPSKLETNHRQPTLLNLTRPSPCCDTPPMSTAKKLP